MSISGLPDSLEIAGGPSYSQDGWGEPGWGRGGAHSWFLVTAMCWETLFGGTLERAGERASLGGSPVTPFLIPQAK